MGLDSSATDHLPRPADVRYHLAFDADNPNSLVSCVRRARSAAREVRESISTEMWEQINTSYLLLQDASRVRELEDDLHGFYRRIRDVLLLIQGLGDATIVQDASWWFLSLGKYLERAENIARLLKMQSHLLTPASGEQTVRLLAILRSAGAAEGYSRFYSLRVEPPRVLEFLLLNPSYPQSVRFSLGAAWNALESVARTMSPMDTSAAPPVRELGRLRARLEHASVDEVIEYGLDQFLSEVQDGIGAVTERITLEYFQYVPMAGRHMAVARAAQIMAAQQQQ
jgi:uncharacterized alpha-E superfamily protein